MMRGPDIPSALKGGLLFLCTLTESHLQYQVLVCKYSKEHELSSPFPHYKAEGKIQSIKLGA